ncbi:MAG: hypothetical protein LQ348_007840 [Seirophora lacunosa]|nr:MAG: hypothetical protein LQ348_007840 [Seirophora lacunosa]
MTSSEAPRNRKDRRAQAKQPTDIPLARPPKQEAPKGKTLLEIASERKLLQTSNNTTSTPSITTTRINPDGSITSSPDPADPSSTAPADYYLDILLYASSLILLHFTLALLVHHQYATSPPSLVSVFLSSTVFSSAPWLILLLVAALHPRAAHPVMQAGFAAMSVVAGGWLVRASNEDPYLAVMKRAPALGTLWVWGVVELRWEAAAACLAVTGGWSWWMGYGVW